MQRAGKEAAAEIGNLQSVVGEEQSSTNSVEWQRLSKEDVIHPIGVIDLDLQARIFASAKLIYAIDGNGGRAPEFVRQNGFPKLGVDPENCLGRLQQAFNIGDPDLVFFEIVGEGTGTGSFIAHYPKILASDGAISEMNFSARAVHPDTAESGPLQRYGSITSPIRRVAILAPNRETNSGRTLPLPLPKKFIQFRRGNAAHCAWGHRAFDV